MAQKKGRRVFDSETIEGIEHFVLAAYLETLEEDADSGMSGALRKVETDLRHAGHGTTVRTVQVLCTKALLHLLMREEVAEYDALWSMAVSGCAIQGARREMRRRTDIRYDNRTFAMKVRDELRELLFEPEEVAESETGSETQ